MLRGDYIEKTYAGWLGKIIGIRLGSPVEGWTYDRIRDEYGEISGYPVDYDDYAADDDSNGPFFFIKALEDHTHEIDRLTPDMVGETWLNYVADGRGFFWWGGYGISTENTAYRNLKSGMGAPRSGSARQNGITCAEQIGGQIFIDSCGFIAPGNPELAAEYARKFASVSHDGNGVYGAMFVAACISLAYVKNDVGEIISSALRMIPGDCEYARVVGEIRDYYRRDSRRDWRKAFRFIRDNFGYDRYPGNCHIIPNSAVMVLSLLYGEGDYSRTLCICTMCGWDTDCNAGNVGAILGVMGGTDSLEDKWVAPIKDVVLFSSCLGSLNISTVANNVATYCRLGYEIARREPTPFWKNILYRENPYFHFNLKKSLQGVRADREDVRLENSDEKDCGNKRSLKVTAPLPGGGGGNSFRIYQKTYYRPADLYDSRYDPSFTPQIFPGQTVSACLSLGDGAEAEAELYALDLNSGNVHRSGPVRLTRDWTTLSFPIPALRNGLIGEVGILFEPVGRRKEKAEIFLDHIEYGGLPDFNIDFSRERIEVYDKRNSGIHREISQFSQYSGLWELDGAYLSGSGSGEGEAYTGYYRSRNYRYDIMVNPQLGDIHLIIFRVQGGRRSYAFGFHGRGRLALLKKEGSYRILEEIDFPWEHGRDYQFAVTARGSSLECRVDGETHLCYSDGEKPYEYGQIGMAVLEGSHCHYRDLIFREEGIS